MSYLPKNEDNLEGQPQGQTSNNPAEEAPPTQSGGSVGDEGGGASGAKGSASGSPTQFGSSASKLGDYLTANAPQIGMQADKVAGKFNDQYSQLNQGITNAANQFNQQVQGGYAAPDQNIVNQAISNPTQFTATPENIAKFQAQYNDQYTGPQNFESTSPYSAIQGQVQNAVTQGNLLQNQQGLSSYLQGQSKNPTKAASTLDSLLLSGNPEAQKKIQDAGKQFNNLTGQLDTAKTGANQSVQDAQKAAQDAATYAKGQVDPYVQNFGQSLNQGANQAEAQRTAYNNSLNNFYSQATPVEQTINSWAGSLPGGANVQDLIAPIIAQNNSGQVVNPITSQNYSTPEQYAQAQAIQQLLGGNAQLPIDQSTVNQAGTAGHVGQPLPGLNDILGQYAPLLRDTYNKALTNPANASKGDVNKNQITKQTSDLVKYLSSLDPQHYQWSQGGSPVGDFSFNP